MKKKSEKPDFMNLRWSENDDKILREMIERGVDGSTLASALGRTRSAIFGRKLSLGIEAKIKRSPKGTATPLTFGTRVLKPKVAEVAPVVEAPVQEQTPEVPKVEVKVKAKAKPKAKKEVSDVKVEKGRLSQTAKIAQINRRLRRGDVRKVAEKTGFTEGFVSTVIAGMFPNERIVNCAFNMLRGRKTNEQMMKK
jgi:hypothetical protein